MVYLLATLAGAGVAILLWSLWSPAPAAAHEDSPGGESPDPGPRPQRARGASMREQLAGPLASLTRPLLRDGKGGALQADLNRAGLTIKASEFTAIRLGSTALLGIVGWLRFGSVLFAAVGAAAGYVLPSLYLRRRENKRRAAIEGALGDTVVLMANGVKAGYSIQQAFNSVAQGGRPPLADEIARVNREVSLGLDLEDALQHANGRLGSKDFDLVVTAISIHRTVGGNLAEVLDKIAETIRERVRVHGEVRVLTAQARASGYIITALPIAVAVILSLISPGFETPLFTRPIGWGMLVVGAISISIGYAIIRKITDIHI